MSNSKSAARPAPSGESTRQSFADIAPVLDFPDFLQIQLQSYHDFLQAELVPEERDEKKGLEATFREHFPITDTRERYTLEYLHFTLEAPKHSNEE